MYRPRTWHLLLIKTRCVYRNSYNGHTIGFHPQTQKNHLVEYYKLYYRKVLLSSFHLNGHTIGFPSQMQKLESPRDP